MGGPALEVQRVYVFTPSVALLGLCVLGPAILPVLAFISSPYGQQTGQGILCSSWVRAQLGPVALGTGPDGGLRPGEPGSLAGRLLSWMVAWAPDLASLSLSLPPASERWGRSSLHSRVLVRTREPNDGHNNVSSSSVGSFIEHGLCAQVLAWVSSLAFAAAWG